MRATFAMSRSCNTTSASSSDGVFAKSLSSRGVQWKLPPPSMVMRAGMGEPYWSGALRHQTEVAGPSGGLTAVLRVELHHDVRNVHARGLHTDEQLVGDLAVRLALRHQFDHFDLPRREPGGRRALAGERLEIDTEVDPAARGEFDDTLADRHRAHDVGKTERFG